MGGCLLDAATREKGHYHGSSDAAARGRTHWLRGLRLASLFRLLVGVQPFFEQNPSHEPDGV
jgi:hypothetical protein